MRRAQRANQRSPRVARVLALVLWRKWSQDNCHHIGRHIGHGGSGSNATNARTHKGTHPPVAVGADLQLWVLVPVGAETTPVETVALAAETVIHALLVAVYLRAPRFADWPACGRSAVAPTPHQPTAQPV